MFTGALLVLFSFRLPSALGHLSDSLLQGLGDRPAWIAINHGLATTFRWKPPIGSLDDNGIRVRHRDPQGLEVSMVAHVPMGDDLVLVDSSASDLPSEIPHAR